MAIFSAEQNHLGNFGIGLYKEHLGEITLKFGHQFWRRCCLKINLILALVAILFGGVEPFGAILVKIEAYEKHLGEIILNLG